MRKTLPFFVLLFIVTSGHISGIFTSTLPSSGNIISGSLVVYLYNCSTGSITPCGKSMYNFISSEHGPYTCEYQLTSSDLTGNVLEFEETYIIGDYDDRCEPGNSYNLELDFTDTSLSRGILDFVFSLFGEIFDISSGATFQLDCNADQNITICNSSNLLGGCPDRCPDNSVCIPGKEYEGFPLSKTIGSGSCQCLPDFFSNLENCTLLPDLDQCLTLNGGCDHICIEMDTGFDCDCFEGYLKVNESSCIDIDECLILNGGCDQICANNMGGFECQCLPGFNISGSACFDINECLTENGGCDQTCINTEGSFECQCHDGWISEGNSCIDVNECLINNGGCEHQCINGEGNFECQCYDGWVFKDNSTCVDIDECYLGIHDCEQQCKNTNGGYECECDVGYILDNRKCRDIDECNTDNGGCDQICINTNGGFQCECRDGFIQNSNGNCILDPAFPCSTYCIQKDVNCECVESLKREIRGEEIHVLGNVEMEELNIGSSILKILKGAQMTLEDILIESSTLIMQPGSVLDVSGCLTLVDSKLKIESNSSTEDGSQVVLAKYSCIEGSFLSFEVANFECSELENTNNELSVVFRICKDSSLLVGIIISISVLVVLAGTITVLLTFSRPIYKMAFPHSNR